MEAIDFERLYPQGLLCDLDEVPEGFGAIYLVTNLVNGKVYVGQTWRLVWERWIGHQWDAKKRPITHLQYAIRRYGSENFTLGLLGWANTQGELDTLEILWIVHLNSTDPEVGYNLTWGGRGGRATEETRAKMSKSHRQRYVDNPGLREKKSKDFKEFWSVPGRKEEKSASQKKRYESPEERNKLRESIIQGQKDPEVRKKMSESSTRRWADPEERIKGGQRAKQALASPEIRKKISEATTKGTLLAWSDPVKKASRLAKSAATAARKKEELSAA